MKFFRFDLPFDFKPSQAVTMHYAAGSVRKVTEAIADAATTAGVGEITDATEEVHVDDTPQLASVIRADPAFVMRPREPSASASPAVKKPARDK